MTTVNSPLLCETETSEASGHVPVYDATKGTYVSRALTSADTSAPGSSGQFVVNSGGALAGTSLMTFSGSSLTITSSAFTVNSTSVMGIPMNIYLFANVAIASGLTRYYGLGSTSANIDENLVIVAVTGVIDQIVVLTTSAPGIGQTYTLTLYKNLAPTAMTGVISDLNTTLLVQIPVVIAPFDSLSMEIITSGGAASTKVATTITYRDT